MDTSTKTELADELCRALKDLGAPIELLAIVGSFGDTLTDADVIRMLSRYNRRGTMFAHVICSVDDPA